MIKKNQRKELRSYLQIIGVVLHVRTVRQWKTSPLGHGTVASQLGHGSVAIGRLGCVAVDGAVADFLLWRAVGAHSDDAVDEEADETDTDDDDRDADR